MANNNSLLNNDTWCIRMKAYLRSQDMSDMIYSGFEHACLKYKETCNKQLRGRITRLIVQFIKLWMIQFFKRSQMLPLQSKHRKFFKTYTKVRTN